MRPFDVVTTRARLVERLSRPDQHRLLQSWLARLHRTTKDEGLGIGDATRADEQIDVLRDATLFLVTGDMASLIDGAARSMPRFTLAAEDFPASEGFVVFDEPLSLEFARHPDTDVTPVAAFSWRMYRGGEVMMAAFAHGQVVAPDDGAPELLPIGVVLVRMGDHWEGTSDYVAWPAHLIAFLRIAQEPYAEEERYRAQRQAERKAERIGATNNTVRVVRLRRAASAPAEQHRGVNWSRRWIVQGHWRQQWYPSQKRHAPRWIMPHIKGPDDKPLATPPTVNFLSR